jgi:hypothetical protein
MKKSIIAIALVLSTGIASVANAQTGKTKKDLGTADTKKDLGTADYKLTKKDLGIAD